MRLFFVLFFLLSKPILYAAVDVGVDVFFKENHAAALKGKRVGLITNQTGIDSQRHSTIDLFLNNDSGIKLVALFAPEHGLYGQAYAAERVAHHTGPGKLPVYSLHGKTRRPTDAMLSNIDALIYDVQDIGCRSYTYTTTLFYVMEEAASRHIPVIVLDRPNPINGITVDGPMLKPEWRSYIGYVNVPYCHGMTVGELACFFNDVYHIHCDLQVIPMRGWKRTMSFSDTGLTWVPTSPNIPEDNTPYYYASTGLLGELSLVNIGVGYTLPFKVIGAPWIKAQELADALNAQKLPGVYFLPFHYRPFSGVYQNEDCEGVMISITDALSFRPVTSQYMILGLLKNLYSKQVLSKLHSIDSSKRELFCKANGNAEMIQILQKEPYVAWKMILFQKEERDLFLKERKKYLLYD